MHYDYYQYNPYFPQTSQQFFPPIFPPTRPRIIIDSGITLKNKPGELRINFSRNFSRRPVVVVSPFWRGQNSQVGFVETINNISRTGFSVVSNNAADNYFVSWIAFLED